MPPQSKADPPDNETFGPLAVPWLLQKPEDLNVVNDPVVSVNGVGVCSYCG